MQGSVLGPLLFLIYINESTSEPLDSNTRIGLYANDMLLYRVINSPNDYDTLQGNVDLLSNWVVKNNLTLNASKCKFMVISRLRKKSVPIPPLKVHNNLLERVSSYKYLGVIISDDLTWSTHINEISNKARKIVRLIYHQFYSWSSPQALLQLYISLVRPHLEYASQVWNPYLTRHIDQLEKIQKFARKVCFKQWRSSYMELLDLHSPVLLNIGNSSTFVIFID